MRRSAPASRPPRIAAAVLALAALAASCTPGGRRPTAPGIATPGGVERGLASWYGPGFHGKRTANGEVYDMHALTAAHRTLPFGTTVEVTNRDNGRRVVVRINDRGPFVRGRIIDLSRAAAEALGMVGPGTARVQVTVLTAPGTPSVTLAQSRGHGRWAVQAGAFIDRDRALDLAWELGRTWDAVHVEYLDGWHRVLIGPFSQLPKAEKRAEELRRAGYSAVIKDA